MMEWAGRVSRLDSRMGSVPLKIRNLHMVYEGKCLQIMVNEGLRN
jgi:hypothetical protein